MTGPSLYDPFFGFAYKGTNSQIRVIVLKEGVVQYDLTPTPNLGVDPMTWAYFSRNLSSVTNSPLTYSLNTKWQVRSGYALLNNWP